MSKTEKTKKVDAVLNCKATAALQASVLEDLKQEDKALGDLLDDKEDITGKVCCGGGSCHK